MTRGTGTCKGYGYATFGDEAAAARAVASLRAVGGRRVGVHLSRRPFRAVLPAAQQAGVTTAAAAAGEGVGAAIANGGAEEAPGAGGSDGAGDGAGQCGAAGDGGGAGGGGCGGGGGGRLHLADDPDSTINTLLHAVRNHPDKMAAVAAALQVGLWWCCWWGRGWDDGSGAGLWQGKAGLATACMGNSAWRRAGC